MSYQNSYDSRAVTSRLMSVIDELSGGCDADFDAGYDDLEREFAELRMQHRNE